MNRQQRRQAAREAAKLIPIGADGQPIGLTLSELQLAAKSATCLLKFLEVLKEKLGDEINNAELMSKVQRDADVLNAVAHVAQDAGWTDRLAASRDVLVSAATILGCWRRVAMNTPALLKEHMTEVPSLDLIVLGLTQEELPDLVAMAQLETKLHRIGDALRGTPGVNA